jgi:hypothetical protein
MAAILADRAGHHGAQLEARGLNAGTFSRQLLTHCPTVCRPNPQKLNNPGYDSRQSLPPREGYLGSVVTKNQ